MKRNQFILPAILIMFFVAGCTLFGGKKEEPKPPAEIIQYAMLASASDAYGGMLGQNRDDQSAFAATGQPDVDKCGDSQKAWVISKEDDGQHWLELEYEKGVYLSKVRIRETFGPGAVVRIEAMNTSGYATIWEGKDTNSACPGYLEFTYSGKEGNITRKMMPFLTSRLRITLDTDTKGWNEIDTVELAGYDKVWYYFNETLFVES